MDGPSIDKSGTIIQGPIDSVFEALFEHAIQNNEIRPAMYMGWRSQRSVAWEVSQDGQLYAINRQNTEDGFIRRVTTKVQIKDTESLRLKSVEFRQVRRVSLHGKPIIDPDPDTKYDEDGYVKVDPFAIMDGEEETLTVTMSLHTTLPEAVIDGLKGLAVSNLVALPERFSEISGMMIKNVTPLNNDLILCHLV